MTGASFHSLPTDITDKFEILEELGEGGMGTVYKVRHRHLDEIQVIKIIHARLARDESAKARFVREARLAKQLRHENIACLIDFDLAGDGTAYIVTEFIEGSDLREMLRTSSRGIHHRVAADIIIQVLNGLSAMHEKGIIHRDISPDNIMASNEGGRHVAKLIDLGLARSVTATALTSGGAFAGKAHYASPEQFGGLDGHASVDSRSDLYSAGVVLYELLTHAHPIGGASYASIVAGHLTRSPRDFGETDPDNVVPAPIRAVVLKALEKNPSRRYQTATEFMEALRQAGDGIPEHPEMPVPPATVGRAQMSPSGSPRVISSTLAEAPARRYRRSPDLAAMSMRLMSAIRERVRAMNWRLPQIRWQSWSRNRIVVAASFVALLAIGTTAFLASRTREHPRARSAPHDALPAQTRVQSPEPPLVATGTVAAPVLLPPPALTTTAETATFADTTTESLRTTAPADQKSKRGRRKEMPPPPQPEPLPVVAAARSLPEVASAPAEAPVHPVSQFIFGGDRTANRAALADLRQQLAGVSHIAIVGSGDVDTLRNELANGLGAISIAPSANVVIDYTGGIERIGRLTKRRSAHAEVRKNGEKIFEYSMLPQTFVIGTSPAVEFANVLRRATSE